MNDDQCQINNGATEADDGNVGNQIVVKQDPDESSQVEIKTEQIEEDKDNNNEDKSEKTNLIVNYLPQHMTDEQFDNLFKKFGATKSCKIVRNRISGFSYGFGFVDFETHEQALKAIDELNGHELENKKIKVAFARPAGQDIKQANLYIKNVPNNWTQDDVRKVFEPYGNIIQVRVLGNNRGVAFVLYDLRKQAEDALDALNGKQVDGCEAPFEIKFAADKKVEKIKGGNQSNNLGNNNRSRSQGQGQGQHQRNSSHGRQNSNNNDKDNFRNQRGGYNDRQRRGQNNNQYDPNGPFNQRNEIGPLKQAPTNRLARYAPFVSAQQPMAQLRTPLAQPMAQMAPTPIAYGYQQPQQMIPFSLMTAQNQLGAMQAVNPVSALAAPTNQPVGMYGAPQTTIPIQYAPIPQNAMSNIYNVATNNLTNAANMQPQLSQNFTMRNNMGNQSYISNHNSNNNHNNNNNNTNNNMSNNNNHNSGTGGGDGCTLFVYNIGPDSDENELRTLFSPYGQVVKCNVVRKTPGGETKGFGFVTLTDRSQASAAIAGLNGTTKNNRTLQVSMKK